MLETWHTANIQKMRMNGSKYGRTEDRGRVDGDEKNEKKIIQLCHLALFAIFPSCSFCSVWSIASCMAMALAMHVPEKTTSTDCVRIHRNVCTHTICIGSDNELCTRYRDRSEQFKLSSTCVIVWVSVFVCELVCLVFARFGEIYFPFISCSAHRSTIIYNNMDSE